MSASDESNQANELELGSLPQYDSADLSELVKKFQLENPNNPNALRHAIQSISAQNPGRAGGNLGNTGYHNLEQLAAVAGNPDFNQLSNVHTTEPYLEILEQPKSKGIRFRYKCEGRSAGSIPGESSSNEHKTFPSVKINNFKGPAAIVVVSCVTKDEPYKPHPHTLVGKECRKGVCTIKLKRSNVATFPNLGIQCVTKKEIKDSLKEREQIRVDPYGTGYFDNITKLHLNIVRLCFQAFLPDENGQYTKIVPPVVSQCIYDKKAVNDLVICRLSKQSGHAKGGDEVFMLCEKVNKDDIQVRFFEEVDEEPIWESFAEFSQSDVHRQFAIVFKTPPYKDQHLSRPVEVHMQLFRPSDEGSSEYKTFQYIPNDPDPEGIERKRKRKVNFETFFRDNNPNTPAFSLLTDTVRENADMSAANLKEKIKAKAARGKKATASFTAKTESAAYSAAAAAGGGPEPPITFGEAMIVEEVEVQTTPRPLPAMSYATPQYSPNSASIATALTELGTAVPPGQITITPQGDTHEITIAAQSGGPTAATDDSGDIMLEDLQVHRLLKDQMKKETVEEEQLSFPSLSNLPSYDVNPVLLKLSANLPTDSAASKLHTDSQTPEADTAAASDK